MLRCLSSRYLCNGRFDISRKAKIHIQCLTEDLVFRGLLADLTTSRENLTNFIRNKRVVYCGIDPTAGSLHVGNLLPLLTLLHFQTRGHQPIVLIGGATGLIGDPSGRDNERPLQSEDKVRQNSISIRNQLVKFFETAHAYIRKRSTSINIFERPALVLNNLDWWNSMTLIDFLHSTGKLTRIGSMLSKESVKNRLKSSSGISFAEFSYQLLQAHDFWHLYKNYDCSIQVGGSDQWGNIVTGLDIIGRSVTRGAEMSSPERALGITTPLLTAPSGQKFGKSAGNAVWLDSAQTNTFDFYQFFLRVPDSEVEQYLKLFTCLDPPKIETIMLAHKVHPEVRYAQRELADEVTELIHGEISVAQARAATRLFFEIDVQDICPQDVADALGSDPRYHVAGEQELLGIHLTKLAASAGLTNSRAEAIRLIESRGLYLNNVPVGTKDQKLQARDLIGHRLAILRSGKDKHVVLALR